MSIPCMARPSAALRGAGGAGLLAALLLLPACEPDRSKTESNPTPAAHSPSTPLPLDPTTPVEVTGWWSNGTQLLRLRDDASYQLWNTQNRYEAPAQTGRWARQNYQSVSLEPYRTRPQDVIRGELSRNGDEVFLGLPSLRAMVRLEGPPPVFEDRLAGIWLGPGERLQLKPDGRYRVEARGSGSLGAAGTGVGGAMIAGHEGTWSVGDGVLTLVPDSPALGRERLTVVATGNGGVSLRRGDADLTRETP